MNQLFDSLIQRVDEPESQVSTSRFSLAEWFHFVSTQRIAICGVGGIGSWLAFMLARLNPELIRLYDPDDLDSSNLGGQLFRYESIGKPKVNAVADMCRNYANYHRVSTNYVRADAESMLSKVTFGCLDNMESRKIIYTTWKRQFAGCGPALFVDGRLSAESLQVFSFTGYDTAYMSEYEEKWLFSDDEAESTVCSYKQTSYCANLIASLMVNVFVNWCTNRCDPFIERRVPFMIEYGAPQMYLKTTI